MKVRAIKRTRDSRGRVQVYNSYARFKKRESVVQVTKHSWTTEAIPVMISKLVEARGVCKLARISNLLYYKT